MSSFKQVLMLVAAMAALAFLMVPTNSFAADGIEALDAPRQCFSKRTHENGTCSRVNRAIPFRKYAERQAQKAGVSVEELITLNGWSPFVDTIRTDPTVVYLILLPEEPVTVASR